LKSDEYRKKVAIAVVEGLASQYGLRKKAAPKPEPKPDSKTIYRVQIGAYADKKNAESLVAELKKKGHTAIIVE
jgi:N-acetylmuramoyl-L-alanine amidase